MTRFWCQVSRTFANSASLMGWLRSMPMISAPMFAESGLTPISSEDGPGVAASSTCGVLIACLPLYPDCRHRNARQKGAGSSGSLSFLGRNIGGLYHFAPALAFRRDEFCHIGSAAADRLGAQEQGLRGNRPVGGGA